MLRTVRVPAEFEPVFAAAEEAVSRFFESRKDDPEHGTIELFGERYILVRAASLSVEFFALVEQLFGPGREIEADQFARNILFDLAHALGKSDARNFQAKMNLEGPLAKLSAGPVIFSHSGWAFVDISPESRPVPNEDFYLLFDHPYSFESDAWLRAGKPRDFPVCIMSAGYSSGWCEESFGVRLISSEVLCRAKGDESCRFIMAPPKRIEDHIREFVAARLATGKLDGHYEIPDFFARKNAEEELQRLYERLKELDTLKTQFFNNVSHELRTPLMLISGPVERLLGDERLTEDQRSGLYLVQGNARILLKHVNDLLDVAKLEAREMRARYAKIDLARLVRVVCANFDGFAAERGVDFRVEGCDILLAEVDSDKVGRILLNLLSNAFTFARHTIRVSLRAEADRAFLVVADDGPGVPPEMREVVFERFRQAARAPTRRFGGTGLGLGIAKDFVELHGGRIAVGDAPGGGALFTVELPLTAPAGTLVSAGAAGQSIAAETVLVQQEIRSRTAEPPVVVTKAAHDAALILLIEDNADMLRFMSIALAEFRIATAADGQEGLEKACTLRPDLIITDIIMPRLSGDALVRELRRRHEFDPTPIIVLTVKTGDELRVRLLGEGALDYLVKPFSGDELLARVRNLVAVKKTRDILQAALASTQNNLEQLAREVAQRKRELQDALAGMRVARENAERASQTKTMFLALVSHELTTPLQSMHLNLESLQKRPDGFSEVQAEKLSKVGRASYRLLEMFDSIIELVRFDTGQLEVHHEQVSLPELAGLVLSDLRPQAQRKGLALRLSVNGEPPIACTDARLLRLILVHLVGNAVKYTARGSVELSIDCDTTFRIKVTDTGPGIPREKLASIFEPFTQLEPVRHKHARGVGLGLTLVREMAKALGGEIRVSSDVGRGSTFVLELPRS